MIYTVTFSPALDYSMWFDQVNIGGLNRTVKTRFRPGGKGINVSIVLKNLGFESICLGFVSGFVGEELIRRMEQMGLNQDFIWMKDGCSRINVKVKAAEETELNASGPVVTQEAMKQLRDKINGLRKGDVLILSGNPSVGIRDTIYGDILQNIANRGINTVVDASGSVLAHALQWKPYFIKPNLAELESLEHRKLRTENEIIEAAEKLRKRGAERILVSMGEKGAMLLSDEGVYRCEVPAGKLIDSTGAGDSMVAAFLVKKAAGCSDEECLRYCTACGSASAYSYELADATSIMEMYLCTPKAKKIK